MERGALVADTVDDIPAGHEVVIRSHGVPCTIYDELGAARPYLPRCHLPLCEERPEHCRPGPRPRVQLWWPVMLPTPEVQASWAILERYFVFSDQTS